MNYVKHISILAGFTLLTFVGCQKDNALNQSEIGEIAKIIDPAVVHKCYAHEYNEALMASDEFFRLNQKNIEEFTTRYKEQVANGIIERTAIVTIPVVVHVVWNTTTQNISDARINSQIATLNADFQKLNADASKTPSIYSSLVADCQIAFKLATKDQTGQPTTGIDRRATASSVTAFTTNNAMKYTAQGGLDAWDATKYLNLWSCNMSGGILGYAQFPGGAAATDGVVILYSAFGTTPTGAYNLGRTATHEVGHWLNLRHIWGDDNKSCKGSDLVDDTPSQADENYGCPNFAINKSCQNAGDMSMNYMDYTDDACMYMFTTGQKTRMQAVINGVRASLKTSPGGL